LEKRCFQSFSARNSERDIIMIGVFFDRAFAARFILRNGMLQKVQRFFHNVDSRVQCSFPPE